MTGRQPWAVGGALVVGVFLGTLFGPLFAQKKEDSKVDVPAVGRYQQIASPGGVPRVLDTVTGQIWDWGLNLNPNAWEQFAPPIPAKK